MRRCTAVAFFLAALLVSSLTGCAGNPAPVTGETASPAASAALIEILHATGRGSLSFWLHSQHVSGEDTARIMASLKPLVDAAIAGRNVRAVLADPAVWQPLRADLVTRISTIVVSNTTRDGVAMFDQQTTELFVGGLLDTFAAAIRR